MSFGLVDGSLFAGRYRIVRVLGAGGMGAVYEAVHLETERRCALKVMLPTLFESPELRDRFKREARLAANVESEFIVAVYDAGVDDETQIPFLVMELLRGEDLDHRVERLGRLAPAEVVTYLHQTALALDKTHKASIVHRDLKPENLFLTQREDGQPHIKVLDFGIAKLIAQTSGAVGATQGVGTPLYMAPEQFGAEGGLSAATDVYALGMVAYKLLVGASYWANEEKTGNLYAILAAASHGTPQPASVRAAQRGVVMPAAFNDWFAKATALRPEDRFQTATAAVRALAETLEVPSPASSPRGVLWGSATGDGDATIPSMTPFPAGTMKLPSGAGTLLPASTSRGAGSSGAPPRQGGRLLGLLLAVGAGAVAGAGLYAVRASRDPAHDAAASTPPAAASAGLAAPPLPDKAAATSPAAPQDVAPAATAGAASSASAGAAPDASPSGSALPRPPTSASAPRKRRYTRD